MTHALSRKRAAVSAAAFALLTLSGCMSEMPRQLPTEVAAPQTTYPPSFIPVLLNPRVTERSAAVSNRVKYHDKGAKPSRVKLGAVAIEMRALLGSDGLTLVEATTGSFDGVEGVNIIEKVQLKALTANSSPFNDRPATTEWTHTVPGLIAGDRLQLQANVKGAGAGRMEVINITTTVVRRPDLSVLSVDGAAQAHTGDPVTFFAQVAELNGEMGARANCVLRINGTPVDQATGIWVDAGGLVTCQFSYVFAATGTYAVTVTAADVSPLDWDPANNGAGTSVTVVTPGTPIAFGQLTVEDAAYTYLNTSTRTGSYPLDARSGGSEMWSKVTVFGTATTPVPAPMQRVAAKVTSGTTTIFETSLTNQTSYSYVSGGANVECSDYNYNGETAQSCTTTYPSDGSGSTWFSYGHQSGTVTFYGQTLYCNTFGCNTFTNNGSRLTGWGERYGLTAGSTVRVQMSFFDATGLAHTIDRSTTLQDFSGPVNFDRSSCAPYWDGLGDVCARQTSSGSKWRGMTTW